MWSLSAQPSSHYNQASLWSTSCWWGRCLRSAVAAASGRASCFLCILSFARHMRVLGIALNSWITSQDMRWSCMITEELSPWKGYQSRNKDLTRLHFSTPWTNCSIVKTVICSGTGMDLSFEFLSLFQFYLISFPLSKFFFLLCQSGLFMQELLDFIYLFM